MEILLIGVKWLITLANIWMLMLITILFHELGHVLMYVLFYGENDWYIDLGIGNFKLFTIGRFNVYALMISGYAYWKITKKYNKLKYIMLYSGGFIVNLIFIILFGILRNNDFINSEYINGCINFLFYTNFYQFLGTITPMKIGNYSSDGMWIFRNLRGDFDEN